MQVVARPVANVPRLPAPLAVAQPCRRVNRATARIVLHHVARHHIAVGHHSDVKSLAFPGLERRRTQHPGVFVGQEVRVDTGRQNGIDHTIATRQHAERSRLGHAAVEAVAIEHPRAKRGGVTAKLPTLRVAARALLVKRFLALGKFPGQLAPSLGELFPLGQAQLMPGVQRILVVLRALDEFLPAPAWLGQFRRNLPCLLEPLIRQRLPNLWLEFGQGRLVFLTALRRVHVDRRRAAAGHDAVKRVVILLANCIEFVVVTARTRHGQTEERLADHVDLVLRCSHQFIERVCGREALQHEPIMRRADGRLVQPQLGIQPRLLQQVARDVFTQQLVVRHIGVECANEVIPVLVRKRNARVALAAERLGVTHPVHPVPRPTFPKMRRRQKLLHRRLDRALPVQRLRLHERRSLLRCRRQADD